MRMNEQCSICGGNGREYTRIAGERGLFYRCSACGLIWLAQDEQPIDDRTHYDAGYYKEHYSGRKDTMAAFGNRLSYIDTYIPKGADVLEVGAAAGDFLNVLETRGYGVQGVELSSHAVELAKRDHGYELFHGTLFDAGLPDESCDAVVSYHVLEHVPDPLALVAEMYRVLKPGGILVIEVPHATGIDARFSRRLLKSILDYPHHRFAFSPAVLRSVVERTGFEVVTLDASPSFLVVNGIRRMRGWFTKSGKKKSGGGTAKVRVPVQSVHPRWYALAGKMLPGMRLTVVARKHDQT